MAHCTATHAGHRCGREAEGARQLQHHGSHRAELPGGRVAIWDTTSGHACPEGTCETCDAAARAELVRLAEGGAPSVLSLYAKQIAMGVRTAADVQRAAATSLADFDEKARQRATGGAR